MIIKSYESVDSLRFGESTKADCAALYGQPKRVRKNRQGVEEYHYNDFIVRFDPSDTTLRECTLLPYKAATLNDVPVTWDRRFLATACREDGGAVDAYGFIVLPRLGIAVTGIHDDDKSQLAITVFSRGGFDKVLGAATPFDAERMTL